MNIEQSFVLDLEPKSCASPLQICLSCTEMEKAQRNYQKWMNYALTAREGVHIIEMVGKTNVNCHDTECSNVIKSFLEAEPYKDVPPQQQHMFSYWTRFHKTWFWRGGVGKAMERRCQDDNGIPHHCWYKDNKQLDPDGGAVVFHNLLLPNFDFPGMHAKLLGVGDHLEKI